MQRHREGPGLTHMIEQLVSVGPLHNNQQAQTLQSLSSSQVGIVERGGVISCSGHQQDAVEMKAETADQTNALSSALVTSHNGEGVAVQGNHFDERILFLLLSVCAHLSVPTVSSKLSRNIFLRFIIFADLNKFV